MKKHWLLLLLLTFFALLLTSCGEEPRGSLTLPPEETVTVAEKNNWYEYDLSEYMTTGDPMGVQAKFDDPGVCEEKEIDEALFQVMLSNATFAEKKGKAERYDKVNISFTMELDGVLQENYSREDYGIVIGLDLQEDLEYRMGEKLIGAKVGETRTLLYTYPDTASYGEMAGKTVSCYGKVKAISETEIPECTDEYVQKLEGYDFQTVAEFREALKKDIMAEKESRKVQAVWSAFCDTVEILKYPEAELQSYLDSYKSYYLSLAEDMEMTLAEFLQEYLETDEESFLKEAEDYAKELVKNDMIFAYLAQKLEISLSDEEYAAGVQEYYDNEEGEFASKEEFVQYYTEENLRRNLIWDKALTLVIDNAVAVK